MRYVVAVAHPLFDAPPWHSVKLAKVNKCMITTTMRLNIHQTPYLTISISICAGLIISHGIAGSGLSNPAKAGQTEPREKFSTIKNNSHQPHKPCPITSLASTGTS